tara:strand:+ start:1704 stop:1931 length:228 start_codon:yes stop_codon:yes gene_type:complete
MTPDELNTALIALAPDALGCIQRTLRGTDGFRPVKAQVDCAWRVIEVCQMQQPAEALKPSEEVSELANVLRLVDQ